MGIDSLLRRKGFSGKFAAACRRGVKIERNRLSDSICKKMCFLCLEKNKNMEKGLRFYQKFFREKYKISEN